MNLLYTFVALHTECQTFYQTFELTSATVQSNLQKKFHHTPKQKYTKITWVMQFINIFAHVTKFIWEKQKGSSKLVLASTKCHVETLMFTNICQLVLHTFNKLVNSP